MTYRSKIERFVAAKKDEQYTALVSNSDHYTMMADRIAFYLQGLNNEHYDVYVLPLTGMYNVDEWKY